MQSASTTSTKNRRILNPWCQTFTDYLLEKGFFWIDLQYLSKKPQKDCRNPPCTLDLKTQNDDFYKLGTVL
jgi:hypothetical protein